MIVTGLNVQVMCIIKIIMASLQVSAIPGWEALFMEMDQFLMALERNKDTSNESYAEYAVERLGVCITCVSRLRHQLRLVDQENSLTVNESAIIHC